MKHAPGLPLWADGIIGGCVGALAAGVAAFFALLGLLLCSGAAGLLVSWAVLRASGLAAALDARLSYAHLMLVGGCAALTLLLVLACECGCGCASSCPCAGATGRRRADDAGADEPRAPRRRGVMAKLGEALITAVIGAYGALFCVSHWLPQAHAIAPAAIFVAAPPERCDGACAALLGSFLGLAALGFAAQALCIRGQQRGRQLEDDVLRAPLDGRHVSSPPPRRTPRETPLASRMRDKYFGRRNRSGRGGAGSCAASGSPVDDLDTFLTDAADRRQSRGSSPTRETARTSLWGSPGRG